MISICPRCGKQVSIPSAVDSAAAVRCPLCEAEYPLADALALVPPELIPLASPSAVASAESETAVEDKSSEISPPTELDHANPSDSEEEENEAAAAAPRLSATAAAAQWKRREPKSPLQMLVEVILGGVAGCLVAYYGLAFWFGPQFHNVGLPDLSLPFIERITAPRPANGDAPKKPGGEKSAHDIISLPSLPTMDC